METFMHVLSACLALAAGTAGAVSGESVGVLAVAPRPGPGPAVVELTVQLRERVAERHPGVLDAVRLRERMTGRDPRVALAELDQAYEAARASWASGDYEASVRALHAVADELERLPEGPEPFARWTRALLRLARSEQSLGRDAAAREAIERLVRAAPDLAVDRAEHPARVVDEVERARAALRSEPVRALAVSSSAAGADVYVEGRRAGAAPLTVSLPRGRYRVSAVQGALRAGPVAVDLREADQQVFLDLTVQEALRPAAGPGLALAGGDPAAQVVAAGAHLGLDRVVAVSLTDAGGSVRMIGSLYDVGRAALVREGRVRLASGSVPVGGTSALAEFLVTGDASSGLVEVGPERRADAPVDLRARPARDGTSDPLPPERAAVAAPRALGWVTLGTGIAAVGLSVVGTLQYRSADAAYDRARELRASGALDTREGAQRYNAQVIEGNDAKRNGTVALAAAGATAVTAGIVGWVNYRRTGRFGPFEF